MQDQGSFFPVPVLETPLSNFVNFVLHDKH